MTLPLIPEHKQKIATGKTGLLPKKIRAYRRRWKKRYSGMEPYVPEEASVEVEDTPSTDVGDILQETFAWLSSIESDNETCSCKTLQDEMNKEGVAWCKKKRDGYLTDKIMLNRDELLDAIKEEHKNSEFALVASDALPDFALRFMVRRLIDYACMIAKKRSLKV